MQQQIRIDYCCSEQSRSYTHTCDDGCKVALKACNTSYSAAVTLGSWMQESSCKNTDLLQTDLQIANNNDANISAHDLIKCSTPNLLATQLCTLTYHASAISQLCISALLSLLLQLSQMHILLSLQHLLLSLICIIGCLCLCLATLSLSSCLSSL
jgi:hypothetical protein